MFLTITKDFQNSFLKPFIQSLCFLYVPYLLGFTLKSRDAFRNLISCVPKDKAKSESVESTGMTSAYLIFGSVFFGLLTVIQLVLYIRGPPADFDQIMGHIVEASVYIVLYFVVLTALSQICHLQNEGGKVTGTVVVIFVLSLLLFAIFMVLGLSGSNNSLSVWVVTLTLVYCMTDRQMSRAKRSRDVFKLWTFSLLMFGNIYNYKMYWFENQSQNEEEIWPVVTIQSAYVAFIPAGLASFGSGNLISRMLRYDCSTYLKRESELLLGLLVEVQDKPSETATDGPVKINLDTFARPFPKPYFIWTITVWSFIRIATIVLCLATGFPSKSPYDACYYAMLVEFPIMAAAVFLFGASRGEAKSLWNYGEVWTKSTNNANQSEVQTDRYILA